MASKKDPKKVSELPEKFKDLDDDKIQKKVSDIESEISDFMAGISAQQSDLSVLRRYLKEKGLECGHENLKKTGEKSYRCEDCKANLIVKVIF